MKNNDSFTLLNIYQPNAGSQVARNTGTASASGEYIQYLDSDDLLYPDKIKNQVIFLKENKNCDGVWGDWEKGSIEKKELIESRESNDLISQFLTTNCVVNFSFLMRKELVQKIGKWNVDIKRNQEIDFQVRGILAGGIFRYQAQNCGLWRIHEGERIANTTGPKDFIAFYEKWENTLKEKNLFSNAIKNSMAHSLFVIATQEKNQIQKDPISILKKVINLNPNIPFYNSNKMKIIKMIFPKKIAIQLWLYWYKRHLTSIF